MKSVITVMGKDGVGIIARVSAFLAQNKINIIDIAQTTNEDQFLRVMVVDMEASLIPFNEHCDSDCVRNDYKRDDEQQSDYP